MTLRHSNAPGGLRRRRDWRVFALLLCTTVALGLGSRRYGFALPEFVAAYAGDTLWAAMVFWLLALAVPRHSTRILAVLALLLAFLVECSQLYHSTWLDAVRATRLGALALGSGFLWSDLVCYVAGVSVGVAVDLALARSHAASDVGAAAR